MKRLSLMVLVLFLVTYTLAFGEIFTDYGEFETAVGELTCIDFEGLAQGGGQAKAVNLTGNEFSGVTLSAGLGADGMFVGIPDPSIPGGNNKNFFAADFFPTSGLAVFAPDLYPSEGSPSPDGALIVDFDALTGGVGAYFLDVEISVSSVEAFDEAGGTGNSLGKVTLQNEGDNTQVFAGVVANGIKSAVLVMAGGTWDGVGIDDLCYGGRRVDVDIKPTSCPNPLNVKSGGVLPVAILGTEDFDVAEIDASTVQLAGVSPLRWSIEDVAAPCPGAGGEGEWRFVEGELITVTLWAGQHNNSGTVTVAIEGENLVVTYETTGSWELCETHLYVDKEIPTQHSPGLFPYKHEDLGGATSDEYIIALSDLGAGCDDVLYLAAHAKVCPDCGEEEGCETAWGEGERIYPDPHGPWAMYFSVEIPCEYVEPEGEVCDCCTDGPDGYDDLTLKFDKQDIVEALGEVNDGDTLVLTLTGELTDETAITGEDCVVIINKGNKGKGGGKPGLAGSWTAMGFALFQNSPNPFAHGTSISYTLPASGYTTLKIYDTSGRLVTTLVDAEMSAGVYSMTWNRKNAASGIYFYRLTSGGSSLTRAMTVIR